MIAVVATPRVPFTRMFHIAHSPATDSETPNTSTRSPCPTTGKSSANKRNGTSITSRRRTKVSGMRPTKRQRDQDQRVQAERPERLTGRRHDREDEQDRRRELALWRQPVER